MKLADKIILLRKQKGWSQEELAAQMDVSRQSVSKWESGASVPDIDKILLLSQIFGITTDYLLKDEVEVSEEDKESESNTTKEIPKRYVTRQEATEFFEARKKASPRMAFGVWLCIVSPVLMMILLGFAEQNKYGITENLAAAVGLGTLFVLVTIAVSLFIINGMSLSKYEYIEKEEVIIDNELSNDIKKESDEFMPVFTKNVAIGVILCIISVIPLVTLSIIMENEAEADMVALLSVGLLLIVVAFGVYRFVKVGILKGSFDQILQREDYTIEKKAAKKQLETISAVYWLTATAIYLAISFTTNRWDISWIIWPVAGVTFGIVSVVVESRKLAK